MKTHATPISRDPRVLQTAGMTLTEMVTVCGVVLVLMSIAMPAMKYAREMTARAECGSRLRQVGQALEGYRIDYRKYPAFAPPKGLGDRENWADLWKQSDPQGIYFAEFQIGGVAYGNRTIMPRVPRLLESYAGDVAVLHCNSQGSSSDWPHTGPYYYHATNPFSGSDLQWEAVADSKYATGNDALAACQNPPAGYLGQHCWRHGTKKPGDAGGVNMHLYRGGGVKQHINPSGWRLPNE